MKKSYIGISIIACFLFIPYSYAGNPGTTGANFLKLGVGARPVGMGEAFCGVADDINSLYWNPAGLNSIQGKEISFMHNFWFEGINYDYLAYAQRIGKFGVIGGNFAFIGYGSIPRTFEKADGTYDRTEGDFTASDISVNISYAQKIMEKFDLGITLKIINETIENYSAFAFGFDIGFLYAIPQTKNLTLGISVQNIGTPLTFIEKPSPLPLNFKLGAGYKVYSDKNNSILTALDINIPIDNKVNFNLGAEYWFRGIIAARIGYKTITISELGGLAGLCAGLGFKWQDYGIDYAFVPYGDLGYTHRISLMAEF